VTRRSSKMRRLMSAPGTGAAGVALGLLLAGPVVAQDPPDSLPPLPDSLQAEVELPDSLVAAAEDSVPSVIRNLPDFGRLGEASDPGVLGRWDLRDLQRTSAITLQELLEPVAGILPIRGGDYATPEHITAVGLGAGRVRVFVDGVEEIPLDGSVTDLSRIPLAGLGSVTLRREGGELRIELESERADEDPRPLTRIEAGTGDLETNLFRGVFIAPDALGGALGVAIERIDTRGSGGNEQGTLQGLWLRYLRPVGPVTLSAETRRGTANADVDELGATETTRSSWTLRARAGEPGGLRGEVYLANNSLDLDGGTGLFGEAIRPARLQRRQFGARGAWDRTTESFALWARGEARLFRADGGDAGAISLPDSAGTGVDDFEALANPDLRLDLDVGARLTGVGGASVRLGMDDWDGESRGIAGLRVWTEPRFGLSAFAELDRGERGWRPTYLRLPTDRAAADSVVVGFSQPEPRFTDREMTRVGARFAGGPIDLSAAWLSLRTDSVFPLGTADRAGLVARGGQAFAGEEVTGFEVGGRIGVPILEGLALVGSLQQWESEGLYRPERIYRGGVDFGDTFYPSENLEIRASFLVEGRDPMLVPFADPDFVPSVDEPDALAGPLRVPFYQSWNAYLQIRIVTVRIFLKWENFFGRADLQDVPGRVMPGVRASYGVRWTFRN